MKDETAQGLSALIKGKKEILWLGSDDIRVTAMLGSDKNRARFATISQFKKLKISDEISLVVVVPGQLEFDKRAIEKLKRVGAKKILIVSDHAPKESLAEVLAQVSFAKIIFENNLRAELNLAIEETRRGQGPEESDASVPRTKAMVSFIKNLSAALTIQEVLKTLREELRNFQAVKEPLLAFVNAQNELAVMFFQGHQILERKIQEPWPQRPQVRLNDLKDSQYLANIFGRPFAKLLSIPLRLRYLSTEHSLKVGAVLFFEHGLSEIEANDFLQSIEERLEPCINRLGHGDAGGDKTLGRIDDVGIGGFPAFGIERGGHGLEPDLFDLTA